MKIWWFNNQVKRGVRIYEEETGMTPEIYEIREHDDDSEYITIHFSSSVERCPGLTSGKTPHLMYSFNPNDDSPNRFKWDGLRKWKRKQEKKNEASID